MFKIINCEQGSQEWFMARLGKWTASFFSELLTPTGKESTSAKKTNHRLVAELIVGEPDETFQSEHMIRGKELEADALNFINFTQDRNFTTCGFIDSEQGYGCSADALDLEAREGLELKCPMAHTHLEYLSNGVLPDKYKAQVQGAMLVTDFKRWVFASYHPKFPALIIVVERDEEYIETLRAVLVKNCKIVKEAHEKLLALLAA
jgi:hypothetical protein